MEGRLFGRCRTRSDNNTARMELSDVGDSWNIDEYFCRVENLEGDCETLVGQKTLGEKVML